MNFGILVVGNEILSGDINETNATYISKKMTAMGHKVKRIVVVPDSVDEIAEELRRLMKYDFVFVTGGLGATHDDVTAEAIAKATSRRMIYSEEAGRMVRRWTDNKEIVEKIATIPEGAEVIENNAGVAPAFVVDNVAVVPGVPAEMKDTFEKIVRRFSKEDYHVDYLRVDDLEEKIVTRLKKVVEKFPDVEIGSYPKPGYVLVKFSGKDSSRVEDAKRYFERLLI